MERSRGRVTAVFAVVLLIGCKASAVPAGVAPTLAAWDGLGVSCSGPVPDNVPSDTVQWACTATIRGVQLTGTLDANEQGVSQILAQVPSTTEVQVARAAFGDLIDATPALGDQVQAAHAWVRAWDGAPTSTMLGPSAVRLDRDGIWTTVVIVP